MDGGDSHAIDKTALWGQGVDLTDFGVHAEVPVTQDSAVQVIAVYACVRLRSETIAALPRDVFRERSGVKEEVTPPPQWVRQPNLETDWFGFMEAVNRSLDLDGNAYVLITAKDIQGFPSEVWTLSPTEITIERRDNQKVFVWGGDRVLLPYDPAENPVGRVVHVKNFSTGGLKGLSPIGVARQGIGIALAAEKTGARFYGRGQILSGLIKMPAADQNKTQAAIDIMKANWIKQHAGTGASFLPGFLAGGAEFQPLSVTPEEAQFLETRRFQINEIARLYGVPPHMIGDVERSTSWGTGIEAQTVQFFITTIMTRLARLESAFNTMTPRGQFLKFNVTGLLRGDARTRAEFYAKAINTGWMVRNEVRELEDLPPLPGLDKPLIPLNMMEVGAKPPAPSPAPTESVPPDQTPVEVPSE